MRTRLGVMMDPIEHINFKKDTTLAFLWEADARGWYIQYLMPNWVYLENDHLQPSKVKKPKVKSTAQSLKPFKDPKHWFELGEKTELDLNTLDVLLMRQDPPFDMQFLYATYLLELAEQQGLLVVNSPGAVRSANEKLFATQFSHLMPETCVSSQFEPIEAFHAKHQDIILKPLDGMGGSGIFKISSLDPNLKVAYELLTNNGQRPIMAQKFIPEVRDGDKRILMINGEPIDYGLARKPPKNQVRANLAAGGKGIGIPLSEQDRYICSQVGPALKKMGLLFVGLDVIGNYLTEINVTSPTCVRELDDQFNLNIAGNLMDLIETKLSR